MKTNKQMAEMLERRAIEHDKAGRPYDAIKCREAASIFGSMREEARA